MTSGECLSRVPFSRTRIKVMNECDQPCDALRDKLGRLKAAEKRVQDLDWESGLITKHR